MSVNLLTGFERRAPYFPGDKPEIYYPETDNSNMGQNEIHFALLTDLVQMLENFLAARPDAHVSGDIMFYYEEGKPKTFVAPDVMVCFGIDKQPRRVYQLWKEKAVPAVIIEIVSESTWQKDITTKFALYQRLGVGEYFVYDPERDYLPEPLMAFYLENGEYRRIEPEGGRVFSPALNLELVDDGMTLRLFNHETIEFLPTARELAVKNKIAQQEIEKLREENARLKQQN